MSKSCIAPSEIITPQAASQFGGVAEAIIESDYLKSVGRTRVFPASLKDFIDFSHGFGNVPLMIAFLKANNPHLSISQLAVLATAGLTKIPDIITHDPPVRTEFYEIKPNSLDGLAAGKAKIWIVSAFMKPLTLPYVPGIQYTPDKRIKIFSGMPLGSRLELFFHFFWEQSGLVVYEICAEGDLEELGLKVLTAIIAAAIVALMIQIVASLGGILVLA